MLSIIICSVSPERLEQVTRIILDTIGVDYDIIAIDIPNHSINVKVSDEILAVRKKKWVPREPRSTTGYLARYAEHVTSGIRGAILRPLKEQER